MVPLHRALIDEGFLRHVERLPAGSPLFPDLQPDTFGTLKGTATKKHGRWVRKVVASPTQRRTQRTHGDIRLKIKRVALVCLLISLTD
jgi:hypothetical protein